MHEALKDVETEARARLAPCAVTHCFHQQLHRHEASKQHQSELKAAMQVAESASERAALEAKRKKAGAPHMVEYFHQLDDPYSHLAAQVLAKFAAQYDIVIKPYLIHATGGRHQPRLQELAAWARRETLQPCAAQSQAVGHMVTWPECSASAPRRRRPRAQTLTPKPSSSSQHGW